MPPLKGVLRVPGDKSISHRALIFSSLARGVCRVSNLSPAQDCASTLACLEKLGLRFNQGEELVIESPGLAGLGAPEAVLDAGNSGTTIRLMAGLVAGRPFTSRFDGDDSLRRRTMTRIIEPLSRLGAKVEAAEGRFAPLAIEGGRLTGCDFALEVASAQVESCLLLAGLQADGETAVSTPHVVRDHTLRMFSHIGVPFARDERRGVVVSRLPEPIEPFSLEVPSDLSSAAFFMVAAALIPGSDVTLTAVGINPGRRLIIDVLERMGADVAVQNERVVCGEPVADIRVRHAGRPGRLSLSPEEVASGVDELPILALAASLSDGVFSVSGAGELRHKETDRIAAVVQNLQGAGVEVEERPDGFSVEGRSSVAGGSAWRTFDDHRLAMTGLIASLVFDRPVEIDHLDCVKISYPGFVEDLESLM